jgi:hypothetical protein
MPVREQFRATARRPIAMPMVVYTESDRRQLDAQLVDLGLGGARLELDVPLAPGVGLTFEIPAPTLWDPLTLDGEVVWATWPGAAQRARIGVRFKHVSPSAAFALFDLLSSQGFDP